MNEMKLIMRLLIKYRFNWRTVSKNLRGLDLYPKLQRGVLPSQRRNPKHSVWDKIKSKFWRYLASKSSGLSYCYGKPLNENLPIVFVELIEKGYSQKTNFLNDDEYNKILNMIKKYKAKDTVHESTWYTLSKEVSEIFDQKLKDVTSAFFAKDVNSRALLHLQHSLSGNLSDVENSDPHVLDWHCDRYIPCMKAIYFPEGCSWLPFEIIETSSPSFLSKVSLRTMKTFYKELPPELQKYKRFQGYVEPNTLLLVFPHVFHRRSEMNGPGERKAIFFDWWSSFTYGDLIMQGLFKNRFR